ncbi:MAG TPA: type 1 glutamine amidotransferase [Usitatibacter sp.]|jgi:GMP synthase-like glutamine amidotransferase|nr:type 1 glutamine amidotransferase [Usitatibacter sp.]
MSGARPVAVFRYSDTEGPGHFATFLQAQGLPWELVKLDEGASVPASSEPYAGLGFMGGPMSANDELAWTQPVLALMRDAIGRGVPMIGHCLGGQMMSRAAGGKVSANPVKEIGWNRVRVEDTPLARRWFGSDVREFVTFQWHGETFTIPPGAERILSGEHCPNQAYVLDGRHLGLQCHVEMTPEMIASWLESGGGELRANLASPAVQPAERIVAETPARLPVLSSTAERLYRRWIEGLRA